MNTASLPESIQVSVQQKQQDLWGNKRNQVFLQRSVEPGPQDSKNRFLWTQIIFGGNRQVAFVCPRLLCRVNLSSLLVAVKKFGLAQWISQPSINWESLTPAQSKDHVRPQSTNCSNFSLSHTQNGQFKTVLLQETRLFTRLFCLSHLSITHLLSADQYVSPFLSAHKAIPSGNKSPSKGLLWKLTSLIESNEAWTQGETKEKVSRQNI